MARNSRLKVCLATRTRNVSSSHCARSTRRHRTTPWMAGMGPLSIIAAIAARCSAFNRGGRPGALAVDQAFRTTAVELHHPVADDLHSDTADPCGLAPRRTL